MGYLSTQPGLSKRANPRLVLPEAKSLISLGMPYAGSANALLNQVN
jgi:epoxyqueuosine reductase QueG